jgi:hypothetical protein
MKVILLTVPGCQPIIGNVIKEDDDYISIEYPVMLFKEEQFVFTSPYLPFAKGGLVSFNKDNVIGVAAVEEELETYYNSVVTELRQTKLKVKKSPTENIIDKLEPSRPKNLH